MALRQFGGVQTGLQIRRPSTQTFGQTTFTNPFTPGGGGTTPATGGGGAGPGGIVCTLMGLGSNCSWAEAIASGYNQLFGDSDGGTPGAPDPITSGGGGGPCNWPMVPGPGGTCVDLSALPPGGDPAIVPQGATGFGDAVYGRFGLALQPAQVPSTRYRCPTGMVLGKDNLCYEQLTKKERKWNPGTRPLGTAGEMAALSKAARFAGRLNRTQKRLKKVEKAIAKAT